MSFNPMRFYRELRRRRMFQVALIYTASAWGLIGACDLLFPQVPQWVADPDAGVRLVIIATLVALPLALAFGWLYDVSVEGVKRTATFSETADAAGTALHGVDGWIMGGLGVLLVAVTATTAVRIASLPAPATTPAGTRPVIPANALAVLPFSVCTGAEVDPLLAFGIADEVMRHLAEVPGLRVSARTAKFLKVTARASAFAFGGSEFDPERISSVLRVRYLLTGTVCRALDALTVTAELVDGDGYLLWTETYTQHADASGFVDTTPAATLADRVGVRLGASLSGASRSPVDTLAYEDLVIGREYAARRDPASARAAFERALQRRPDYPEAMYELALLELPSIDALDTGARLEKTKALVERAQRMARAELAVNPSSARVHFVLGETIWIVAELERDLAWRHSERIDPERLSARFAEAERHLRKALEINPSDSITVFRLAGAVEAQGRDAEALAILEGGRERDPFNTYLAARIAKRWAARGRLRDALNLLQRFEDLPEMPPEIWWWRLELATLHGHWDEKCGFLIEMLENDSAAFADEGNRWQAWWFIDQLQLLGLEDEADVWRQRLEGIPLPEALREIVADPAETLRRDRERVASMSDREVLEATHSERSMAWIEALVADGEYERAIRLMESIQYAPAAWTERQPWAQMGLAALYLEVGREADAAPLLAALTEGLETELAAGIRQPQTLMNLADVYALQGEDEAALGILELAVDSGGLYSELIYPPDRIGSDPWQNLRGQARFEASLERTRDERDRQVDQIRAMLSARDPDVLLAPLMGQVIDR